MQLGMIGLGRMGANMVRRLIEGGHQCVVFDRSEKAVAELVKEKAVGSASLADFVKSLAKPRVVWLMVPVGAVDKTIADLLPHLERGDILSGGVWGLERGFCMMIGGETDVVRHLDPLFATLAPGRGEIPRTPGRDRANGTSEQGYLHCGPGGAGHFVKMVHNGIEYGIMAAYSEGLAILNDADIGQRDLDKDAETAPLQHPEFYKFDIDIP